MAELKLGPVWRVDIVESERGWGRKIDESKYFDNAPEASKFVEEYNKDLVPGPAPDWYMQAEGPYRC